MKKMFLVFVCGVTLVSNGCFGESKKELKLSVSATKWYTEICEGYGYVYLDIEGHTNGEKASITTGGDGFPVEECLNLDQNGNFSSEFAIQFTTEPDTAAVFKAETKVTAYASEKPGDDGEECAGSGATKSVNLASPDLSYANAEECIQE